MLLNSRKIFLLDGIGAIVSAFCLGVVLVYFNAQFGMPKSILYWLAGIAVFFSVYSFFCYFKIEKNWKFYLKIIAILNLLYCLVTAYFVCKFYPNLTSLGVLYFVGEIIVIVSLVSKEFQIAELIDFKTFFRV